MSWINDVRIELKALELSRKKLRSFGLLVGGVFILISIWILYTQRDKISLTGTYTFGHFLLTIGGILFLFGVFFPSSLKSVYKVWMGFAIALGWIVSRFIIIILFYIVVTPVAMLARLFGKKFLDLKFRDNKESYWTVKDSTMRINYKKMY